MKSPHLDINQPKRKADPQVFVKLHRNQLKSKLLFKAEPDVFLSQVYYLC